MARRRKKLEDIKKRNLAAKQAVHQPGAGPMDDKRRKSRQQQRIEDEKRMRDPRPE
ncbi:MAG: hypothetical protein H6509_02025 [Bryobacterales bacterium]|nr:hypothetical protein [Bryobacterales bacterium]